MLSLLHCSDHLSFTLKPFIGTLQRKAHFYGFKHTELRRFGELVDNPYGRNFTYAHIKSLQQTQDCFLEVIHTIQKKSVKLPQNLPSLWHATLYLPVIFFSPTKEEGSVLFSHQPFTHIKIQWYFTITWLATMTYETAQIFRSTEKELCFSEFYGSVTDWEQRHFSSSKQAPEFIQVNFHLRPMKSSLPTSISWLCWIFKSKMYYWL